MTEQSKWQVTDEMIESTIAHEYYFKANQGVIGVHAEIAAGEWAEGDTRPVAHVEMHTALNLITFCVLVLVNGYTLTGKSVCLDPAAFDEELGKKYARQDAIKQAYPVFAFSLAQLRAFEVQQADLAARIAAAQKELIGKVNPDAVNN